MTIAAKQFYFIRHGQTDWNTKGLIQGHTDTPLNDIGRNQALAVKPFIEKLPITHIYHSSLQRAARTASIIAENLFIPVIASDKLKECHLGDWQGTTSEIDLYKDYLTVKPPNGETFQELSSRVKEAMNQILSESPLPLIVAHGGTYVALCHLMNLDPERIDNCKLLQFVPPNDTCNRWMCYTL